MSLTFFLLSLLLISFRSIFSQTEVSDGTSTITLTGAMAVQIMECVDKKGDPICEENPFYHEFDQCVTTAVGEGKTINQDWILALFEKINEKKKLKSSFHQQLVNTCLDRLKTKNTFTSIIQKNVYDIPKSAMEGHTLPEDEYFTILCYFKGPFSRVIRRIVSQAEQCYEDINKLIKEKQNPAADTKTIDDKKAQALVAKALLVWGIYEYYTQVQAQKIDSYDCLIEHALRSEWKKDDRITRDITEFVVMFLEHMRTHFKDKYASLEDVKGVNLGEKDPLILLINQAATEKIDINHPTQTPSSSLAGTTSSSLTGTPSSSPTGTPSSSPTGTPTSSPTGTPTSSPTETPSSSPTSPPISSTLLSQNMVNACFYAAITVLTSFLELVSILLISKRMKRTNLYSIQGNI